VLCQHCKKRVALDDKQMRDDPRYGFVGLKSGDFVCEPVGCDRCGGSGYRGRIGLFEILEPDAEIRSTFRRGADATTIEMAAMRKGFRTMNIDAHDKIIIGITSPTDVFRVTPQRFYG
jgi:general secretion pathway protein E